MVIIFWIYLVHYLKCTRWLHIVLLRVIRLLIIIRDWIVTRLLIGIRLIIIIRYGIVIRLLIIVWHWNFDPRNEGHIYLRNEWPSWASVLIEFEHVVSSWKAKYKFHFWYNKNWNAAEMLCLRLQGFLWY